jgi:excisionase family DNA binding protein
MLETYGTPQVKEYPYPLPKRPLNGLVERLGYSRLEAAQMLGISLRTVDRLIAEKQLPVRRIGKRVLITRDVLTQFVKRDHPTADGAVMERKIEK